jgi:hypothetical protein
VSLPVPARGLTHAAARAYAPACEGRGQPKASTWPGGPCACSRATRGRALVARRVSERGQLACLRHAAPWPGGRSGAAMWQYHVISCVRGTVGRVWVLHDVSYFVFSTSPSFGLQTILMICPFRSSLRAHHNGVV